MPLLTLVRHGQASFGADDYDLLSDLGHRQCAALGAYWRGKGRRFSTVYTGTLRRHRQSLDAIARELPGLPPARTTAALDEYDGESLVHAVSGGRRRHRGDTPDARREHFAHLREGLAAWMAGTLTPPTMPSWAEFEGRVAALLTSVRENSDGGDVLVVSSGGPIATAIAHVLGAPPPAVVMLNMQMRNSAVSEFTFTRNRHLIQGYNALPHLDDSARADWLSYS